jgi:hypothetical protein
MLAAIFLPLKTWEHAKNYDVGAPTVDCSLLPRVWYMHGLA